MAFPLYTGDLPYLTTEQMIEVDRAMIEDYQIDLIQMMENAGRALALVARARFVEGDPHLLHEYPTATHRDIRQTVDHGANACSVRLRLQAAPIW